MANAHAPGVPSPDAGRSVGTPAGRRVGTRVTVRIALEALGVLIVVAFALIAVAHVLQTQRAPVLLSDGDSVILPIMLRSFASGEPQLWSMSAVFFAFPEIPLYLLSRAVGQTPQLAFIVNGVLNLLAAYLAFRVIVRAVATKLRPQLAPALRIAAAIIPVAWVTLLVLLEHTMLRDSFELASLFLTTTYYSGSTLGLLFTIGILAMMFGTGGAGDSDSALDSDSSSSLGSVRDVLGWLIALGALTALCVFSNPLYGVWVVAPAAATALIVATIGITGWRRTLWAIGVLATGSGVGLLLRVPFSRNIATGLDGYIRANGWAASSDYYGARLADTAASASGAIEIVLVIIAAVATVAAAVFAIARRWQPTTVTALLASALTVVTTFLTMMILGTEAARYFAPVWFGPMAALAVGSTVSAIAVQRWWAVRHEQHEQHGQHGQQAQHRQRSQHPHRTQRARVAAILATTAVAASLLVSGGVSVARILADPDVHRFAGASCVSDWVGDRDLTGAGEFWTIRGLQAFSADNVHLLQIDAEFHSYLWITNAADYTGQDVSYLVVDAESAWYRPPEQDLGQPAARIDCGAFTILDYRGTPGEQHLTSSIGDSAKQQRADRGLER